MIHSAQYRHCVPIAFHVSLDRYMIKTRSLYQWKRLAAKFCEYIIIKWFCKMNAHRVLEKLPDKHHPPSGGCLQENPRPTMFATIAIACHWLGRKQQTKRPRHFPSKPAGDSEIDTLIHRNFMVVSSQIWSLAILTTKPQGHSDNQRWICLTMNGKGHERNIRNRNRRALEEESITLP